MPMNLPIPAIPAELVSHLQDLIFVGLVVALSIGASVIVGRVVEWFAVRLQAPRLSLRPLVITGRFLVLVVRSAPARIIFSGSISSR